MVHDIFRMEIYFLLHIIYDFEILHIKFYANILGGHKSFWSFYNLFQCIELTKK